jgi:hypothetical protein
MLFMKGRTGLEPRACNRDFQGDPEEANARLTLDFLYRSKVFLFDVPLARPV